MSPASAWTEAKNASRPRFQVPIIPARASGETVSAWAEVSDTGGLTTFTPHMSAADARQFGRWIRETYGEPA